MNYVVSPILFVIFMVMVSVLDGDYKLGSSFTVTPCILR